MKQRIPALASSFLIASSLVLHAAEPAQKPCADDQAYVRECALYSIIGGRSYMLRPTRQEIDELPLWNPASGEEPPVSPAQAIRIAKKEFAATFKDADDWFLGGIQLSAFCGKHWGWLFTWQPKQSGDIGVVLVPVLMSGAVIPLERLAPSRSGCN